MSTVDVDLQPGPEGRAAPRKRRRAAAGSRFGDPLFRGLATAVRPRRRRGHVRPRRRAHLQLVAGHHRRWASRSLTHGRVVAHRRASTGPSRRSPARSSRTVGRHGHRRAAGPGHRAAAGGARASGRRARRRHGHRDARRHPQHHLRHGRHLRHRAVHAGSRSCRGCCSTPLGQRARHQARARSSRAAASPIFTAGVVLAFMILPFITAVSRDVLQHGAAGHQGGRLRHGLHHLGGHAQDQPALRQQRHRGRRVHRPGPRPRRDHGRGLHHRQRVHVRAALAASTRARPSPR